MNINPIQKRFVGFTICMVVRIGVAVYAMNTTLAKLKNLGYLLMIVGLSMIYLYMFDLRKVGAETIGSEIWWNKLRVIHGGLLMMSGLYSIKGERDMAWKLLLLDPLVGLFAFMNYHNSKKNFFNLI